MIPSSSILIEKLELTARIGITEEERSREQRLTVSLVLWPKDGFPDEDKITRTVDYVAVCAAVRAVAASRARELLETLARETASALMEQFPLSGLDLDLRKYVLPDTEYVGVRINLPP